MATPYKINIPMYEGPLDLLLDLIKQQKMSIHDIQISKITAQYLDYLHKLEELDVDVSSEFIYMAATLIYIKSKMLLPPDPLAGPEEAEDPRADLVQRLVEHEKFKNAAQLLYQKQQIEENVWSKPDKSLYNDEGTEGDLVVSLVDLVRVFQQVLERRKEVSRIELRHEEFTVAQMIAQIRAQILASADNAVNLVQFFEACPSRHAMIVAFLAVLEMVKLQAVALAQEKQFGEILVRKHKMFDLAFEERGIEIRKVAGGYKLFTKPQQHDVVRRFIKSLRPPLRLSMPALETLAVIAYKQPVTSPEISEIRGVNTAGVISTLLDKHLITTAGRKEVMGRPILYKTSKEFLLRFGLSDLDELPSLKEFEALAREALGSDEGFAPVEEGSTSEANLQSAEAVSAKMEKREELLEETAANNEGMPEAESREATKAATAGE